MENNFPFSEEIFLKAQNGDQEAFGEIFELFVDAVYRFVLFRAADLKNAELLTEEIFLKIWKNLKKFHLQGKTPFPVWVFQLTQEALGRFLKNVQKVSPERRKFLADQENATPTILSEYQDLLEAFTELPDTQVDAIVLRYFSHLSNNEIALVLEKTEGAVRILQSRGLKRLREILEEREMPEDTSSEF